MTMTFVLVAEERSAIESSVPTIPEITASYRQLLNRDRQWPRGGTATSSRASGALVGSSPRVTRAAPLGAFVTRAAWPYTIDGQDAITAAQRVVVANHLRDDLHLALREGATHLALSDDWTVTVIPYNPIVHGPMAWWQGLGASHDARFIDEFPTFATRLLPLDNPIGPNDAHGHATQGEGLSTLAPASLTNLLTIGAVVVGVVAIAYAVSRIASVGESITGTRQQTSTLAAKPRANPSRRRRAARTSR